MPAELDVLPLLQDKAQDQSGLLGLNFIWDRAILTLQHCKSCSSSLQPV